MTKKKAETETEATDEGFDGPPPQPFTPVPHIPEDLPEGASFKGSPQRVDIEDGE
jgi:hypothetical protein